MTRSRSERGDGVAVRRAAKNHPIAADETIAFFAAAPADPKSSLFDRTVRLALR